MPLPLIYSIYSGHSNALSLIRGVVLRDGPYRYPKEFLFLFVESVATTRTKYGERVVSLGTAEVGDQWTKLFLHAAR
jgi:hypothetical protein